MSNIDFVILYVENPLASAAFYERLLGRKPVEASPGFAMFPLDNGAKLGLWAAHEIEPPASARGGGAEIAFVAKDKAEVDARCAAWGAQGLTIALKPTKLDFGYAFVALDPDGHRLRVFAPGG
jgi:catechol 2,3-dioxygenase-like lactoylglutathione lyase family enzyme